MEAKEQPGAANASAQSVVEIMRELTSLLSREVDLLRAMQIREFGRLQDRKATLINAYEQQTNDLRGDPSFAKTIDPLLRDELKDVTERMTAVVRANEQAISAAREINNRVAEAIIDAVQSTNPGNAAYSDKGGYRTKKSAPPISVQIDGRF